MLKSMLIHQRDSKGIIKSNFVTSCFAFRGSIPMVNYPPLKVMLPSYMKITLYALYILKKDVLRVIKLSIYGSSSFTFITSKRVIKMLFNE